MSEFKHTPAPWTLESIDSECLQDICLGYERPELGSPVLLATAFGSDGSPDIPLLEAEANAARIVACVNACERAGLSNADLDGDEILRLQQALRQATYELNTLRGAKEEPLL